MVVHSILAKNQTTRGYHPTIPTLAKLCTAIPHVQPPSLMRISRALPRSATSRAPSASTARPGEMEKWQPPDPGSNQKIVVVIFEVSLNISESLIFSSGPKKSGFFVDPFPEFRDRSTKHRM